MSKVQKPLIMSVNCDYQHEEELSTHSSDGSSSSAGSI
jgi:hypothetical protein